MSLRILKTVGQLVQQVLNKSFTRTSTVGRTPWWLSRTLLLLQQCAIWVVHNNYVVVQIFCLFVEYLVERMNDLIPSLERTVDGYKSYISNKKGMCKVISLRLNYVITCSTSLPLVPNSYVTSYWYKRQILLSLVLVKNSWTVKWKIHSELFIEKWWFVKFHSSWSIIILLCCFQFGCCTVAVYCIFFLVFFFVFFFFLRIPLYCVRFCQILQ